MPNVDYREQELGLTSADREALRQLEKDRRKVLESYRDYKLVDADQHYYEPDDCFSRHLEQKYQDQAIEVRRDRADGLGRIYRAGQRFRRVAGPMGDRTSPPGVLREYFKSQAREARSTDVGIRASEFPEFVDRQARLRALDAHDVQATVMLPTLGMVVEAECGKMTEPDVWFALMRSFNRWVEDDWGYGSDGRIFGVPLVSLFDPDLAVVELDRLIEAGAKVVVMRAGPVYGRSPADPIFDPFWARAQEANVVVAFHVGDHGYEDFFATEWGYGKSHNGIVSGSGHPFVQLTCGGDRAIQDTVAALIFGNLFGRFPQLRCMIIELGASWVPGLLKKLDMIWRRPNPKYEHLDQEPSTIYKQHFWISPYYEDPWEEIVQSVGASRVVFGSDWPHPEGLPEPLDILEDMGIVSSEDLRMILRDNTCSLLGIN